MIELVRQFDDYRLPIITACCESLGLPLWSVTEVDPGHYSPAIAIDLYPYEPPNGTISYRSGQGVVAVRRGIVGRLGVDAAAWDPPMTVDDATVCDALAAAHRGLFEREVGESPDDQ